MDTPVTNPYITKGMLGGITVPIEPLVASRAEGNSFPYPSLAMAGIRKLPSAATVAGPEPEIAAKKQEAMTTT